MYRSNWAGGERERARERGREREGEREGGREREKERERERDERDNRLRTIGVGQPVRGRDKLSVIQGFTVPRTGNGCQVPPNSGKAPRCRVPGGKPREQKMLKRHLPTVIYTSIRRQKSCMVIFRMTRWEGGVLHPLCSKPKGRAG
jgi:hypothetical protein